MTVIDPYTGIGVITRGVFDSDMAAISISFHLFCNAMCFFLMLAPLVQPLCIASALISDTCHFPAFWLRLL